MFYFCISQFRHFGSVLRDMIVYVSVQPSITGIFSPSVHQYLLEWLTQEPLSHCHKSGTSDCWRFLERRNEFLPVLGYIPPDSVWFVFICFSRRTIRNVLNDSKHSLWFLVIPDRVQFMEYSPVTGEFPEQKASNNAENVSIWWRHHVILPLPLQFVAVRSSNRGLPWVFVARVIFSFQLRFISNL